MVSRLFSLLSSNTFTINRYYYIRQADNLPYIYFELSLYMYMCSVFTFSQLTSRTIWSFIKYHFVPSSVRTRR